MRLPRWYIAAHRPAYEATLPRPGHCLVCWQLWPCLTVLDLVRRFAP